MSRRRVGLLSTPGATAFLLAVGIDTVGTGLFVPISLLYFIAVTDVPLSAIGILLSAATALTLPLPLVVGGLVDSLGARGMVVTAQLIQAVGFLAYLVVTGSVGIFFAALLVASGQRIFWSSFFTLVADLSGQARDRGVQDRWFAFVGMVQGGAFGVGGLLAGLLAGTHSGLIYRLLAVSNAVTFVVAAAMLVLAAPGRAGRSRPGRVRTEAGTAGGYRVLFADRPYLTLIAVNTAFALCSTLLAVAVPVYIVDGLPTPKWIVGPLFAVNTILLTAGQAFVVRSVRSLSRVRALVLAGACWVAWCLGLALAVRIPSRVLVPYLLLVMLWYTAAELLHAPLSNALAAAAAPEGIRGRYLAAFQYSFNVANILAPGLFTVLYTQQRSLPWLVVAGLTLAGTIGMATLERTLPAQAVHGQPAAPVPPD